MRIATLQILAISMILLPVFPNPITSDAQATNCPNDPFNNCPPGECATGDYDKCPTGNPFDLVDDVFDLIDDIPTPGIPSVDGAIDFAASNACLSLPLVVVDAGNALAIPVEACVLTTQTIDFFDGNDDTTGCDMRAMSKFGDYENHEAALHLGPNPEQTGSAAYRDCGAFGLATGNVDKFGFWSCNYSPNGCEVTSGMLNAFLHTDRNLASSNYYYKANLLFRSDYNSQGDFEFSYPVSSCDNCNDGIYGSATYFSHVGATAQGYYPHGEPDLHTPLKGVFGAGVRYRADDAIF